MQKPQTRTPHQINYNCEHMQQSFICVLVPICYELFCNAKEIGKTEKQGLISKHHTTTEEKSNEHENKAICITRIQGCEYWKSHIFRPCILSGFVMNWLLPCSVDVPDKGCHFTAITVQPRYTQKLKILVDMTPTEARWLPIDDNKIHDTLAPIYVYHS